MPARRVASREVVGYCFYDFANSSYTTLISTVAYSVYFRRAVVGVDNPRADFLWSATQIASILILVATAPILGALADFSGRKKLFLLLTTVQTVAACALLYFVRPGDVWLGVLLYVVGTVGFEGGYVFYNAFLPEIATPRTIGRISGWSWGIGFIGGLLALLACAPFLAGDLVDPVSRRLDLAVADQYRLSFVVVALFFALFSVPTFLFLRERGSPQPGLPLRSYVVGGFRRVATTLRHLRRHRETAKYVLAALFFHGGIDTVIKFSAIYASVTFGIQGRELLALFVFTNLIAVPGTLLAGYAADWVGGRRALAWTLLGWCALLFIGSAAASKPVFWLMAGGIAIGMGSTQAIGRSLMAQLSPPSRESEFFGFYLLCSKVGSIPALALFGLVADGSGSQRLAVLSAVPFFLAGWVLVRSIREPTGPRAKNKALGNERENAGRS